MITGRVMLAEGALYCGPLTNITTYALYLYYVYIDLQKVHEMDF